MNSRPSPLRTARESPPQPPAPPACKPVRAAPARRANAGASPTTGNAFPIRVAVVEDEPASARLLASLLEAHAGVSVVGVYGGGREAADRLASQEVDAIFVDVQIPDFDGFELVHRLAGDDSPEIVFVTAYDQYALRAFEVAAVDFLLKPFDEERLATTVERLRSRLADRQSGRERDRGVTMPERAPATGRYPRHLPVWLAGEQRAVLLNVQEILWIEADGKRLIAHAASGAFPLPGPLRDLEPTLDPEVFIRISRSAIVNVSYVREIHKLFRGDYLFVLRDGKRVRSSASGRDAVNQLLRRG
jgi:two-component system LytT family response regulator